MIPAGVRLEPSALGSLVVRYRGQSAGWIYPNGAKWAAYLRVVKPVAGTTAATPPAIGHALGSYNQDDAVAAILRALDPAFHPATLAESMAEWDDAVRTLKGEDDE